MKGVEDVTHGSRTALGGKQIEFTFGRLVVTQCLGDGYHTWQYQEKDLDVLKDPSVKAAFIVNPSNPPSYGRESPDV